MLQRAAFDGYRLQARTGRAFGDPPHLIALAGGQPEDPIQLESPVALEQLRQRREEASVMHDVEHPDILRLVEIEMASEGHTVKDTAAD